MESTEARICSDRLETTQTKGSAMSSRFTTILFLVFSSSLHAEDRKDVLGFWASEGSIFMIYEEAEQLHGEIVALKDKNVIL